uniref:SH2 domain-containing protein n=1 Tax=Ornithorhynchus anatinus TaxID=9258 RepID=A0A6I8PD98_ORNAN
ALKSIPWYSQKPSPTSLFRRINVYYRVRTHNPLPQKACSLDEGLGVNYGTIKSLMSSLIKPQDGTFLVRDYSKKSTAEPYVLALLYQNKVYNIKIRFLERSRQYALGTGLRGDEKFDSVEDIIEHYRYSPITLIDGKDKTGNNREQCYLTHPLPFRKHPHFPSSR